jgi:hypothetical protein
VKSLSDSGAYSVTDSSLWNFTLMIHDFTYGLLRAEEWWQEAVAVADVGGSLQLAGAA